MGSQEDFDWWDQDLTCPSIYLVEPDMTVRAADDGSLDVEQLHDWL